MSILSMDFLCFAGLMLAVYYILPRSVRAWSLLAFSTGFVILNGWQGGVHLLAVSLISWLGALGLQRLRRAEKTRRQCARFRRLLLFLLRFLLGSLLLLLRRSLLRRLLLGLRLGLSLGLRFGRRAGELRVELVTQFAY